MAAESITRQRSLSHPAGHTDVHEPQQEQQQQLQKQVAKPDTLACGLGRRTVGICLLLIVVVLWTASNFLASVRWDMHFVYIYLFILTGTDNIRR